MTKSILRRTCLAGALLSVSVAAAAARQSPYATINAAAAADPITVKRLRGGVAMLSGSGGNIGVLAGPRGFLLVDAGIAVSKAKIQRALATLGRGPVRFVIDTHWHWDHTDGNGWLRRSGATILADQAARRRLTETIRVVEWEHVFTPVAAAALPNDVVRSARALRFAGETIAIAPYRPGHTDGDLSVRFAKADVLATGDTFWNGMYPFIDYAGGGSIDGAIRAANANLERAGARAQVIPGHGPLGDRAALVAFRDMLVAVRTRVARLKSRGLSEDQVVAARPTAALDGVWGKALISGELFTRLVYKGV